MDGVFLAVFEERNSQVLLDLPVFVVVFFCIADHPFLQCRFSLDPKAGVR